MTVTPAQLVARVRKLAAEQPHRTAQPVYVRNGQCECIIAEALVAEGISITDLSTWVDGHDGDVDVKNLPFIDYDADDATDEVTAHMDWLWSVQDYQDLARRDPGYTWSVAVILADDPYSPRPARQLAAAA